MASNQFRRPYNFKDMTGQKIGRLTFLPMFRKNRCKRIEWLCECDCGNIYWAIGTTIRYGLVQSCGCWKSEVTVKRNLTHGMTFRGKTSKEYMIWACIVQRCTNPKNKRYPSYGGRGIKMCERWRHSPSLFVEDMGPRPSERHSVERIDNDGNYEPSNCKWADDYEQANNSRQNVFMTFNGKTQTVAEWSREQFVAEQGITMFRIRGRLAWGWTDEEALTVPLPRKDGVPNRTKEMARAAVGNAVQAGYMPPAKCCNCANCYSPASEYHHHKGYDRENWLDVQPLCLKCHRRLIRMAL